MVEGGGGRIRYCRVWKIEYSARNFLLQEKSILSFPPFGILDACPFYSFLKQPKTNKCWMHLLKAQINLLTIVLLIFHYKLTTTRYQLNQSRASK